MVGLSSESVFRYALTDHSAPAQQQAARTIENPKEAEAFVLGFF